jgi:hypothetical protein
MMALPKSEVERTRSKYSIYAHHRFTLRELSQCPHFLAARSRLHELGYFDWHIFDAVILMMAYFRMNLPMDDRRVVEDKAYLGRVAERVTAYFHTFYEVGDEPMPPCEAWRVAPLQDFIHRNGLVWLGRRGIALKNRVHQDEMRALLEKHGYFEADPKPDDFIFPVE